MDINKIIRLIECAQENEFVDFKQQFYVKEKKYDLIKDIISFANNCNDEEKYIIFGIDNTTGQINNVDYNRIEDISNYIQLISEYCDPFINIAIEKFIYKECEMAVLIVNSNNSDRPYLIKKEWTKENKLFLRKGEIYIRKGASNFICSRDDLDSIYDSRRRMFFYVNGGDINAVSIKNGLNKEIKYALTINFINNTRTDISIKEVECRINLSTNCLCIYPKYIEDYKEIYRFPMSSISNSPLLLRHESQTSKIVIMDISSGASKHIQNALMNNIKPLVEVILTDLEGKIYKNNFLLNTFNAEI